MSDFIEDTVIGVPVDDEPGDPMVGGGTNADFNPEYPGSTPEAPYGFRANGQAYQKRPPRRTGKTGGRKGGRKGRRSGVDYAGVVRDLIMSIAQPLGMAGVATKNVTLIAHSYVFTDRAEPVATAMGHLAEQNDKIAAAIEKFAEVSPYAELTTAIIPAIPQFMCNMGMIQPGVMGTIDPRLIAAQYLGSEEVQAMFEQEPATAGTNGDHA